MAAVNPPLTANERATRSVFVGNIPYEATEEQLKDIFAQVGPVVSFRLVYDRETGKPKGYGFCEYQDVETAQSAMRNLNNYDFGGRPLRVGVAAGETNKDEMKSLQQAVGAAVIESPYGDTVEPEKAPEAISKAVASLPPEQMYELMKQMKLCIQNNPNEARNMLLQNPQLAYALLQAQIVMKIVDPQVALAMLYRQSDQIPPLLPTSDNKRSANAQPMDTSAAPGFSPKPMSTNAPNSTAPNLMGLNTMASNSAASTMAPNSMAPNTSMANTMGMSPAGPGQNFGGPMGQGGPSNMGGMMGGPQGRGFQGDQRGPGGGDGGRPGGRPPGLLGNAPGDVNLGRPGGPPDQRDPRNMDSRGAPGMDPALRGMDQRLPGMDPRGSGMDPRGGGGPGMDRRGPGMDRGMDPRGMDQRDRGMDPRGGGGMEMRGGMDPRGGGMDPRGGPPRGAPGGGPQGGPPGQRPGPPGQRPGPPGPPGPAGGDMGGAPGQSPGQGAGGAQDKEKAALIMQVLQLTDQQIAMLPPDQRQSILILKEQIARSGGQGGM